jgi:hypothetical protein
MPLGRNVKTPVGELPVRAAAARVNTRTALWPNRWPAIALQQCVDLVEAAPPDQQATVKRELPCGDCELNTACLTGKRKELGPLLYDREILTRPRSQESTLFPFDTFAPMLRTDLGMVEHYVKTPGMELHEIVVSGWDLAWAEKVGGDYLVRTTALIDLRRNKRRLLNLKRFPSGLRYSEQLALIEAEHRRWHEDLVVIESDAAQRIWAQGLEQNTSLPVFRHYSGDKRDFHIGVPGLLIDFDARRWEFPYNEHAPGFDEMLGLLSEFEAFGWTDGKLEGVGEHDDRVMSFWHCWHGCQVMLNPPGEGRSGAQPGRVDRSG